MIHRYVFIKLDDEHATDAGRADLAAELRRRLPTLPSVRSVNVAVPADPDSLRSWDLALALRFDDLAGVAAYLDHPDHVAVVREVVAPRAVVVKAWNFGD